jgi:hypothetical protein
MLRAVIILGMTGLGIALALILGGCATFATPVSPEYRRAAVNVAWIETDQVKAVCRNERALACALPADPCTIYTYPQPAWETLGHELGHCFLGYWHP